MTRRVAALLALFAAPVAAVGADGRVDIAAAVRAAAGGHVSEGAGLRAVHAWTRATSAREALVFVEIENLSDMRVTLTGGGAEIAGGGGLVGFRLVDGAPGYAPIEALPLDAGGDVVLAPNRLALRLAGLSATLAQGDSFAAVIETDRGPLPITVAVEAADADAHSHAGHAH